MRLPRTQRDWFDYSEQRMMAAIRRLPGGTVVREGRHDPVPGLPDGVPIKAIVTVDPDEARIDVDLRDNLDCLPCGLNLTEATARTAAMMGVFTGLATVVPLNAGAFRRLTVQLRENCIVGIPATRTAVQQRRRLLRADGQPRGPRVGGSRRGLRPRSDRSGSTCVDVSHLRRRSPSRERSVRQPADPRGDGRCGGAGGRRVADDPRHRGSRLPPTATASRSTR